MKYLCLVYYDEQKMAELSQAEWDALNRECMDCVGGLQASGHFLEGAPLLSTDTATTLRVRDSKAVVTDGPFAETKEQLAGFYMLEARDMNEAIRLAEKIPPARYGCVEIRPVRDLMADGNLR
ncbi:YciI family protein [Parahaliea mediterranea]|uniref:YciI family protein n=1 Tax=Parahaliea mediterranea TaxID=651086 RepID=UPI000E2E62D6|nr:YciI family protein [Parahaliea mediterranea]